MEPLVEEVLHLAHGGLEFASGLTAKVLIIKQ